MRSKLLITLLAAAVLPAGLVHWPGGQAAAAAPLEVGASSAPVQNLSPLPPSSTSTWRTVPNNSLYKGEDLNFVVKWGVITGGYSTLSIRDLETINGRPAFHLVEEAQSAGIVDTFYTVHDRTDAWLDQDALITLRYEKRIREGHYRIEEVATFDQENHRFQTHAYRIDKKIYEDKEGNIPPNALDVLSSLYYVRTLNLHVGASYTFDVLSGDKVYPLVVDVKKRQKIKVPAGKFDCFLVEPLLREPGIFVTKGKKLEVWMTADERHIPVRMRSEVVFGHVSAELLSYHLGAPEIKP